MANQDTKRRLFKFCSHLSSWVGKITRTCVSLLDFLLHLRIHCPFLPRLCLFGGTKFSLSTWLASLGLRMSKYINIIYELDSTRQKFDVWIGVAFVSDNAKRPVERAAEMRQPIQTSNFCRIEFVELNSTQQKCDVWTGPKTHGV